MVAKEERVLEASQTESEESVGPECNRHCGDCPSSVWMIRFVSFYDVFLSTGNDRSDGKKEWSEEEAFTLGLDSDERTKTTRGHGQGVVRPCVVPDSLSKGKIWLIRVLPARHLSVLVPS